MTKNGHSLKQALFVLLASASLAHANPPSSRQDLQRAYDAARQCFVANGHVYSAFKNAGDTKNTELFDARAKQAFDLAYFYGDMLKLSQQQVQIDLKATENAELPKLIRDGKYLTVVAKNCKARGLM